MKGSYKIGKARETQGTVKPIGAHPYEGMPGREGKRRFQTQASDRHRRRRVRVRKADTPHLILNIHEFACGWMLIYNIYSKMLILSGENCKIRDNYLFLFIVVYIYI